MIFRRYGLYLTWVIACIATLVSLYFSGIRNLEPCHLCWYQRICLFPLSIILGIATYQGNYRIAPYVLPLVLCGFGFAAYQVAIQEIPGWNPIDMCGAGPSCSEKVNIGLGPITIPMLSATTFVVLAFFIGALWKVSRAVYPSSESN